MAEMPETSMFSSLLGSSGGHKTVAGAIDFGFIELDRLPDGMSVFSKVFFFTSFFFPRTLLDSLAERPGEWSAAVG